MLGRESSGARRKSRLRDAAICLSLANLCFLNLWAKLESNYFDYFRNAPRDPTAALSMLGAVIASISLVAGAGWTAVTLLRRSYRAVVLQIARLIFIGLLLIPVNLVRTQYNLVSLGDVVGFLGVAGAAVLGFVIAGVSVWMMMRWTDTAVRIAQFLLLVLLPLLLITILQTAWLILRPLPASAFADRPLASPVAPPRQAAPRIVWLVFDELDQHLTFLERPVPAQMPEMDRLRGEAIYASQAYRPGQDTLDAMPALIMNEMVGKTDVHPPDELWIRSISGSGPLRFGAQPNLFSEARQLGFNTAVVGWYHPYCRMFNDSLNACYWQPAGSQYVNEEPSRRFLENLQWIARKQIQALPLFWYFRLARYPPWSDAKSRERTRRQQIIEYTGIHKTALRAVVDRNLGLVLVHWPVPHLLGIYSRSEEALSARDGTGYIDNLDLVDRTVAEVRRTMEKAGVWENSTVLVTSDHPLRLGGASVSGAGIDDELRVTGGKQCPWVPFLLKLANQRKGFTYDSPFSALLTHDLFLSILRGEVSSPDMAFRWLDRYRGRIPLVAGGPPPR